MLHLDLSFHPQDVPEERMNEKDEAPSGTPYGMVYTHRLTNKIKLINAL
jgi:hypothetical protein